MLKPIALAGFCVIALVGCSTYVNIPAEDGSIASDDANLERVRNIQVEAINALIARQRVAGPVKITLAPGSSPETYAAVLPQIAVEAVGPDRLAPVAIAVTGVRIRTYNGEVDLAVSGASVVDSLVTVSLDSAPLNDWWVDRIRPWGPINDPARTQPPAVQPPDAPAGKPADS